MRQLLVPVIIVLSVFTAIGLACAVKIALRPSPARRDPFFHPFGDVPGLSDQQLREVTRRSAERIARDPLRRSFAVSPRFPIHDTSERPRVGDDGGGRRWLDLSLNSGRLPSRPDADGVGVPHSPRAHAVRNFFQGWRHA
jgi:hypothetical protein